MQLGKNLFKKLYQENYINKYSLIWWKVNYVYFIDLSKPTDADSTDGGNIDGGLPGVPGLDSDNYITVSNVNWRQGRQLLRQ